MLQLLDKRGRALDKTFADLKVGECYQDCADHLCMKIGFDRAMIWDTDHWIPTSMVDRDELVIPLKTTITVEREDM